MLTRKQIDEVREHLEKAQNPLFFYDNDADGLCSFLILRRFIGRGKGVAVKSYPDLNAQYARKAQELRADYVFVLDKPIISKEFLDEIDSLHLPLVIIDHHDVDYGVDLDKYSSIYNYNPAKHKGKNKSSEPVTYWCYKITQKKEELWLAVIGCIADHHMPDFTKEFAEHYSEFWTNEKMSDPFDAYYKTDIGRVALSFSFGLKDSISNVVHLQNFLIGCKGPDEVFLEIESNAAFREKYYEIKKKYDSLLARAEESWFGNLLFFDYGGDMSISADLSNALIYKYPKKYIAVAFMKGNISNISIRGKGVKNVLEKVLKQLTNASGGGHMDAVGARIQTVDLAKLRELLENEVN